MINPHIIRPQVSPFSGCTTKQECFDKLRAIENDIWESFVGMPDNRPHRELLGIELKKWQDYCAHYIVANGLDIEPLHGVH
jgi:hypothetical protein